MQCIKKHKKSTQDRLKFNAFFAISIWMKYVQTKIFREYSEGSGTPAVRLDTFPQRIRPLGTQKGGGQSHHVRVDYHRRGARSEYREGGQQHVVQQIPLMVLSRHCAGVVSRRLGPDTCALSPAIHSAHPRKVVLPHTFIVCPGTFFESSHDGRAYRKRALRQRILILCSQICPPSHDRPQYAGNF